MMRDACAGKVPEIRTTPAQSTAAVGLAAAATLLPKRVVRDA